MIGTADAKHWRDRVAAEKAMGNLAANHRDVLHLLQGMIEAGEDQPSHQEIAAALRISLGVVRDATKRGKLLGYLSWEKQFDTLPSGLRRQRANRYTWHLPANPIVPRPDVRRRGYTLQRPSKEVRKTAIEPSIGFERPAPPPLAVIAQRREAMFAQQWQANRTRIGRQEQRFPF